MAELTHLDEQGAARMVDVGAKPETARVAIASGRIRMSAAALTAIRNSTVAKGDVLATARIAGIMAAKRTADLIPLCHPLGLDEVTIDFAFEPDAICATCTASRINGSAKSASAGFVPGVRPPPEAMILRNAAPIRSCRCTAARTS